MSKKSAILDITSDSIRLVLIDSKYSNSYYYNRQVPYEGYQDGAFFEVQELYNVIASLIKECEETTFIKIQEILVGVPGEFTSAVCQNVDYDLGVQRKINEKDLDVLFQTGKEYITQEKSEPINSSPIYYLIDQREKVINPIGKSARTLTGLISYILCEKSFIKLFDSIAETNNVKFRYTSALLSQVMFIIPNEVRDKGIIFIDLGYISSTVSYVQGDGIVYMISFSLGGGNVAADLTIVNEIPFDHSLELLKKINLNIQPLIEDEYHIFIAKDSFRYNMKKVNEVALARLEEIGQVINRAISICPNNIPKTVPILISGTGVCNIVGSKEILTKTIERNISYIAPNMPQMNKYSDSSIASLVLLSEYAMQNAQSSFLGNLIKKIKNKFSKK